MRFINLVTLALTSVFTVNAEKIFSCTEPNTIALTFDDGPYEFTLDLLDELKENNMHATFFINGYNYWHDLDTDPEKQAILTRAVNEGHQIASHTWRHAIPEVKSEIKPMMDKLDDVIEKATGYRPKYFRPPKGDCKGECVTDFEDIGYKVIQWDTDTNDWDFKKIGVPARVKLVKKFLAEEFEKKKENYLVLMHDVNDHTVHQIVPWIIENGPKDYKYVTVAECLGDNNETHVDSKGNFIPREGSKVAFNSTDVINTNSTNANSTVEITRGDNSTDFSLQNGANSGAFDYFISNVVISTVLLIYAVAMVF
ncbi:glycoside hydrolase/deacetylase [Neocallimastix californiae]|jgi:peptidoglycan/xylan/chitin deacetylase (PgdA/CDA1 family)|uniref:Glycoside hydrolase/deacetylase n=1 Tax=Neocallimastix californiae TaxID=1754190 RepID=A0A1Y2F737_9FUNG|nr:glycoside hydrolase/deacetylase [Neocallimastix californiae]|eukprot:ORY79691.1 glycoside hydrolase/deacetylase [Neocallimastix californiae]